MLYADYKKYRKYGGNFLTILFFTQGFWALVQYRIANAVYKKLHVPVLRELLLFICLIWQKFIEVVTGISIPASAVIGHSFYIGHFGGIILNANAVVGDNCNISQGVTIGVSGQGVNRGIPTIGNNVYIGANAVIVGNITIGNNVLIGACSLVNKSCDDEVTLLGVPAVVVSNTGSKGYI